ncbi:hypothetical protein [Actinomyces urogenitalis]|uniref:hypothetical protein n=1 Tax=Actinomyces urogenitalis TaxID=103621 RepID=UPI00254F20D9|nr:hypothetical protein [Actinomyces urogenitalis]MDK8237416.1 hypothetical protein [Actinomyces urogenitalis]MDU5427480.1 hypothetical protein [Actinomyces urogenitalis]WOO94213.1 hypothetical protein R3I39_05700 [Actinomyces urogenitalis]
MRCFKITINGRTFLVANQHRDQVVDQVTSVILAGRGALEFKDDRGDYHGFYLCGAITVEISD